MTSLTFTHEVWARHLIKSVGVHPNFRKHFSVNFVQESAVIIRIDIQALSIGVIWAIRPVGAAGTVRIIDGIRAVF